MVSALHTKHKKAGGNFIKNRITYKFLQTSRTGLNLDSYVVSSNMKHAKCSHFSLKSLLVKSCKKQQHQAKAFNNADIMMLVNASLLLELITKLHNSQAWFGCFAVQFLQTVWATYLQRGLLVSAFGLSCCTFVNPNPPLIGNRFVFYICQVIERKQNASNVATGANFGVASFSS